ncbi:copper chaperone PCu(A)C [Blastococcus sp. VKM Ac-2987]|uniref:copper chaperone PCu(A)C n=1 Tax=Blastococcus sp. VKM Ac-2987 TaxID=3004141 RepID=UPI0022AB53A5|nr:copper chaperone PCu(A)C [Blastococcus sp. VKM Ac-2987]MCZ2858276.1 copper chaperone PCu(A)C [Blastococcus sp. VKM Ac-2987]
MNRALRAATMGVLLLSPLALSACSAGQVTQTASQQRDKVGAMAEVGDITLRAVAVNSPEGGGAYEAGDDATVRMAVVNSGNEDDTLTGVSGEGFDEAVMTPAGETASDSTAGSGELEIPARSTVFVGAEGGPEITLSGLDEALTTGQSVELVLTFENAGEVTVGTPVATPEEFIEREEAFDFHHEEEEGESGAEEANREDTESAGGGNPGN